jgi:hypothetical protein
MNIAKTKSHETKIILQTTPTPTSSQEILQEIPRNPKKSQEIPRNPEKSQEIPRNPKKSSKMPWFS